MVTVMFVLSVVLNVATVVLVVASRRYANRAEYAAQAIQRDRDHLNRSMTYQHPRILR